MRPKRLKGPGLHDPAKITVGELYFQQCQKFSTRICQVDAVTGNSETFALVKLRSVRAAMQMAHRGVVSGDCILVMVSNSMDDVILLMGAMFLAAKPASFDAKLTQDDMKYLISVTNPKLIFAAVTWADRLTNLLNEVNVNATVVLFGTHQDYPTFEDFCVPQAQEERFSPEHVNCEEVGYMYFSSGVSGPPKVACFSHKALVIMNELDKKLPCKTFIALHLSNLYSWYVNFLLMNIFVHGGSRILTSSKTTVQEYLRIVEKYHVSVIIATPQEAHSLVATNNPSDYDLSSLQFLLITGQPMPQNQFDDVRVFFKTALVSKMYGIVESGPIATPYKVTKQAMDKRPGSSGKVFPGITLQILNAAGGLVAANERGEIHVKSKLMMVGYYSAEYSFSAPFDEGGFHNTRDYGYYDTDDYLYIVCRTTDIFKYRFYLITPATIEESLMKHPAVLEAVVFSIPGNETDRNLSAAAVVLRKTVPGVTAKDILKFLEETTPEKEHLKGGIAIVHKLPKTVNGKIIRYRAIEELSRYLKL